MKQILFAVFALTIGLSLSISTYAQEKDKTGNKEPVKEVRKEMSKSSDQAIDNGKPVNTICPVSGEEADQAITYTYDGKTYALCCNKCLKKFKADPGKYISRMKENQKPAETSAGEDKK